MGIDIYSLNIYHKSSKPLWTTHFYFVFTTLNTNLCISIRFYSATYCLLMWFPIDSFAFVLVAYQNETDSLARKRYFRMLSEIDFIYSYRVGISVKRHLSTNIPQTSSVAFHLQNRIDICFVEIFWKFTMKKYACHIISLKSKIFNLQLTSIQ